MHLKIKQSKSEKYWLVHDTDLPRVCLVLKNSQYNELSDQLDQCSKVDSVVKGRLLSMRFDLGKDSFILEGKFDVDASSKISRYRLMRVIDECDETPNKDGLLELDVSSPLALTQNVVGILFQHKDKPTVLKLSKELHSSIEGEELHSTLLDNVLTIRWSSISGDLCLVALQDDDGSYSVVSSAIKEEDTWNNDSTGTPENLDSKVEALLTKLKLLYPGESSEEIQIRLIDQYLVN